MSNSDDLLKRMLFARQTVVTRSLLSHMELAPDDMAVWKALNRAGYLGALVKPGGESVAVGIAGMRVRM